METYTLLRSFADSWHLLFMTAFFIGVVVWAFRPGSRRVHDDVANSIFRNDDRPLPDVADAADQTRGAR
jgi:cytochrome c oxidase cbb3-type subunit IV